MSFRDFLKRMEEAGEVIHLSEEFSPVFEISAIMQSLSFWDETPIVHFDNIQGYSNVEIVGNVCATRKRLCVALETTAEKIYGKISEALNRPERPRIVNDSPVKEVIEEPKLSKIPILRHFERDAGPYITSAIVSARSYDGEVENVSVHRLLVLDDKRLVIRLVPRHLYKLWSMAKEVNKDLDVAIAIGVHPAVLLAAASSPPFGVSEFEVANRLLDGKLKLIKCEKVNAYAPAESEIILEGRISRSNLAPEGPFVDITGAYDSQRLQPVVEIVNVMRREKYIYHALLPGGPEHMLFMGLPREAAIYDAVSRVVPGVKAVNLSLGGCGWLHAVISIEKQTDGDAKNALLAAFAAHPSLKHAVVVDSDIDVFNPKEVEWAIATRFQADEDLIVIRNVRGSTLDPSADMETGLTSKVGLDATRPLNLPSERFERARIPVTGRAAEAIRRVLGRKLIRDSLSL